MHTFAALILTLAASPASVSQDRFGAELRAVNESTARTLSGYAAPGVAVVKVQPSGMAEAFDLVADDVILEVNGTRTLQPADVTGAIRPQTDANTVTYSRRSRKWIKSVVAERPVRAGFLVAPEVADDRENEWIGVGRTSGVAADVLGRTPADLSRYAAIVVVSAKPLRAESAAAIQEFVRKGGGVVLVGMVPQDLSSVIQPNWRRGLSPIASWLGASDIDTNGNDWEDRGFLAANVNNPVGSRLRSGDQLFSYIARADVPVVWEVALAETTGIVAKWNFRSEGGGGAAVGAFTNRYGEGRVYWQSVASSPNHPKLSQLLAAGIRWAAGIGDGL